MMEDILEYWFEGVDDETVIKKKKLPFKKWFISSRRIDQEIRERFKSILNEASEGKYEMWEEDMKGRLALILLFDQFSRNIYRGSAQMYAYDSLALDLTLRTIKEKSDGQLFLIERIFLYMPLMHAEDLQMQELSVQCFEKLVEECKTRHPENVAYYEYHLSYAKKFYEDIRRDGRFLRRDK